MVDRSKLWLIFTPLVLLFFAAYLVVITLSENRIYNKTSIDYFVLTPSELSGIAELCKTPPVFLYSSADGPKPAVISVSCKMDSAKVLKYLSKIGFGRDVDGIYKKDNCEIELFLDRQNEINKVTLLEYL